MDTTEFLGAVAHPGGLLVRRPELTVGVVRAVSRPSGLEIELLARRPLDRRSATERQRDIREGLAPPPVAPRRLLPAWDEGEDLRVGRVGPDGRAHWEFAVSGSASGGDYFLGEDGPSSRAAFRFPATFDEMSLVLAWPEIGFPETVVTLPLPGRATVEQATTSIWQAPLDVGTVPDDLTHHADPGRHSLALEAATSVAPPRVLHRLDDRVAVVLTRLSVTDSVLSMELFSVARGERADVINVRAFSPSRREPPVWDDPAQIRAAGPGPSLAVIRGHEAFWLRSGEGASSGGDQSFSCHREFTLTRPQADVLDLVVAWPLAGLQDVRVRVPLGPAR
ncbi:hypothetical protein [Lentzea sp. NPDC055074]